MISDVWIANHFDVHSPDLAADLHGTLARARQACPIARSDAYNGGYWVASRYDDVLRIAQDWQTWSSELGITVPAPPPSDRDGSATGALALPVGVDPPIQREFKRLINRHLTPAAVAPWEAPTRALVTELIDGFVERGHCELMAEFANPLPGRAFFQLALNAPLDELDQVSAWASAASRHTEDGATEARMALAGWVAAFLARRRAEPPRDDIVDAVLRAEVDGRPITDREAIATVLLLIFGGLDTTAGVLGMAIERFCRSPEIPAYLREHPERIEAVVEEILRLDGSFICIGRTARHDTELDGRSVKAGERVIIYWASANRDEAEFERPHEFDVDRPAIRHLAFGAGPHRCAGSHLARMNLRIALEELVQRLHEIRLAPEAEIVYHSAMSRTPVAVPITFTPGPKRG